MVLWSVDDTFKDRFLELFLIARNSRWELLVESVINSCGPKLGVGVHGVILG
jgi:hypothetical protein